MRYESEVLYDLMKRDGLLNPSQDNLPYESELKEKYVDEVKGAYPKVTDYRPEWLNYNLGYYIPADFPTESLVNVTSGTVNNVVPYAFKSAILKGNTLVNLMTKCKDVYVVKYNDINNPNNNVANISMMKPNTEYTLFYKAKYRTEGEGSGTNGSLKIATSIEQGFISNYQKYTTEYMKYDYKFTTSSVVDCFVFSTTDKYFAIKECVLLEGDYTNVDIPFFEGMTSVKAPVLHSVGKNLYNPDTAYAVGINKQDINNEVDLKPNTQYTFYPNGYGWAQVKLYNNTGQMTRELGKGGASTKVSFTTTNDEVQATLVFYHGDNTVIENVDFTGIQLEEGSDATPFEPYKSNILTVNEDVTLRKIGDVEDEFDALTGQVTERVGEVVLDGSENWSKSGNTYPNNIIRFDLTLPELKKGKNTLMISDKFTNTGNINDGKEIMTHNSQGILVLGIDSSRLSEVSVNGLKSYLSQNPITIQYEASAKSIKTVELTSVNQDGVPSTFRPIEGTMHIQTDGTPLKPLFSGEIPVEATTQNLASFVNLEGVERTVNEYVEEEIVGDENNEQLL